MIRLIALLCLGAACWASPAKLIFTKSFPGSSPAYVYISVERTGALIYKEAPQDSQPTQTQLPEGEASSLFALADKLNHFKNPIESGLKVANTGKKTFRYEDENGVGNEVVFNYSTDESAGDLWNRFESIAETERAYMHLDSTARFDKLGVNEALAEVESLWLRKQLAAPLQFLPLLTRIATHESYMHLVRDRAAKLKDEFTGVVGSTSDRAAQPAIQQPK